MLKKGEENGFGRMIYSDSKYYRGEWKETHYHGEGKLRMPFGEVKEGNFKNNIFEKDSFKF